MNIFITGGGGFLGSHIVRMLLERGDPVRVFGRSSYPELRDLGAECVKGDVRDTHAVKSAAKGADTVFHVASLTGIWGKKTEFFEINIKGTANVIQACLENKIERLVYTSSPSVVIGTKDIEGADESLPYPTRHAAPYPASKAEAEKLVLAADEWEMVPNEPTPLSMGSGAVRKLRTCALRPHLIWGPGDPHLVPRIIARAVSGKLRRVGNGRNKVDITYIDNAAQAHLQAADELCGNAKNAGKAYFIGDSEPVILWDWIDALLKRLDVPVVNKRMPYPAAHMIGGALEAVHTIFPSLGEPAMTRFLANQLARSHYFSHRNAHRDFGYSPIVDSRTGLTRLVRWLRDKSNILSSKNVG